MLSTNSWPCWLPSGHLPTLIWLWLCSASRFLTWMSVGLSLYLSVSFHHCNGYCRASNITCVGEYMKMHGLDLPHTSWYACRYFDSSQLATPFQPFLCQTIWHFRIPSLFRKACFSVYSFSLDNGRRDDAEWVINTSKLLLADCREEVWRLPPRCLASFPMCDRVTCLGSPYLHFLIAAHWTLWMGNFALSRMSLASRLKFSNSSTLSLVFIKLSTYVSSFRASTVSSSSAGCCS